MNVPYYIYNNKNNKMIVLSMEDNITALESLLKKKENKNYNNNINNINNEYTESNINNKLTNEDLKIKQTQNN